MSFVLYSPPGSALFHQRNEGWTTSDYLLAQTIDVLNALAWMQSADAQRKHPQHRPEPIYRPGVTVIKPAPPEPRMTVGEYAAKAGIQMNWEEES